MVKSNSKSKTTESMFTDYELLVITIFQNTTQKIVAAVDLYLNKYSYSEAYFLSIIAQEELAKLVILPIAKELGEMDEVINNRSSAYYRHSLKQKIFTNFGLQNRTHDEIEILKQSCLYVGVNSENKPILKVIKPDIVLAEIKHTVLFLTKNYRDMLFEETFSEKSKKAVGFFMEIIRGCIIDRLPEISDAIVKNADEMNKKTKEEKEYETHKALFTNPYELVKIFKALFKEDYKKHLKEIGYFSITELEEYLEKID